MKLSMEIIKEYLKVPEKPLFFKASSDQLNLSRPVFFTGESPLKSHTLYIAKSDLLPAGLKCEKDAALLCIGRPSAALTRRIDNLLVFEETLDILTLSNLMGQVFDLFDTWEAALLSAPIAGQTGNMFQRLLDASSPIFENGMSLMSNNFTIVFETETNALYGGYNHIGPNEGFSIPADIINYFKYDKDYQRITKEHEVFYYEGDVLPHRVLCKNIFQGDQFLFRIILTECIRPFRKTDEVLLEFLSDYLVRSLRQTALQNTIANEGLNRLLLETIETEKINRKAMESELRRLSWNYTDTYRVAVVHASSDDLYISTLTYFAHEFMQSFPGSIAFSYRDTIFVLLNETKAGAMESWSDRLSIFIRENNFRIGISNFFQDISSIASMYRQAEMALSIGLVEKPMVWIHWFSRYTLQYIYNMLTNNSDLGQLYSPVYFRLERYDKENGTSYLETLKVYLENNQNTVQTAKALYIQRSTMIYRLKRIREIANNNLESPDDLLHLNLTFSMIRYLSRETDKV